MVMYELIADLSHLLLPPELHHFLLSIRMFRQHECRGLATGRYSGTKRPDLYLTPQALHKCLRAHWASPPLRRLVYGAVETPPFLSAAGYRRCTLLPPESVDCLLSREMSDGRRRDRRRKVVVGENGFSGERVVVNCFHEKPTWGPIACVGAWAFAPALGRYRDVSENRTVANC